MAGTRRLAAIMFTDTVGFTAGTQSDESNALRRLQEQEILVRPIFAAHGGREIKSMGDGFLVEFGSALQAIQCAIEIQTHLNDRNSQKDVMPISIRIGVHLGDVVDRAGDIFGDAVNIASRIETQAGPGGVCVSGPVFDQVRNKIPYGFEKLGPKVLKNVRFETEVYRVSFPWNAPASSPEGAPRTRLAVLPLANISPDPKDEYFADGLTEELISGLSKLQELRVVARTSVSQYKLSTKSVSQIGAELDVATILEGSVRKAGNRLRITLQLIETNTQEHIWAQTYDRELEDVFAIQTEIAEKTAEALRLTLLSPERESIRRRPTSNLAAYNLYLRGLHAARQSGGDPFAESIKFFEQAIAKDPDFSLAYSYLANTYLTVAGESLAPGKAFPRAKELVSKALDLDPASSDAHTARGNLALQCDQDWGTAETEFQRALSLNPSNASAHFWYAILFLVLRRYSGAIEELRTAIELDPLWDNPKGWLNFVFQLSGDLTSATAMLEEERERHPQKPEPHVRLGIVHLLEGRGDEARKEAELASRPALLYDQLDWAVLWARLGNPEEARRLAGEWETRSRTEFLSTTLIAALHAVVGEHEKALEWLDRGHALGESGLWLDYQWIAFDSIRHDPRFQGLLAKLNVPTQ